MLVLFQGSRKHGFTIEQIVLEEDGTEIDGNDELFEFSGATILGLAEGQVWTSLASCMAGAKQQVLSTDVTTESVTIHPVQPSPTTEDYIPSCSR